MKQLVYIILVFMTLSSCSKSDGGGGTTGGGTTGGGGGGTSGGGGGGTTATEANIAFTIDIDPGSGNVYAALGASQNLKVNISSTLPTSGVNIDLITKRDLDGVATWTSNKSSLSSIVDMTIDSLKPGVLYTSTITVTSKSTSTNTLSKSFKIARK